MPVVLRFVPASVDVLTEIGAAKAGAATPASASAITLVHSLIDKVRVTCFITAS
jgi:hypothetical protein